MKKYRLLKDLPGCKAGLVFEHERFMYLCQIDGFTKRIRLQLDIVEENPDWFEEIVEE